MLLPMKRSTFRRRGVPCTASATRVIVSSTQSPHKQRESFNGSILNGACGGFMIPKAVPDIPVLGSAALMASRSLARSRVRF